jgi:hypothetical protein
VVVHFEPDPDSTTFTMRARCDTCKETWVYHGCTVVQVGDGFSVGYPAEHVTVESMTLEIPEEEKQ